MKIKKHILIFIFIITFLIFYKVDAKITEKEFPLFGKLIYIDPGHGGRDPGAIYKNIYE